jgi:hydroxymethylbilane synthase
MDDQDLDAVILACAGLDRLGREDLIAQRIPTDIVLPAIGQGALAIVVRSGDALSKDLAVLNDPQTACAVSAERGFLLRMGGDCTTPLACLAESSSAETLRVRGLVAAMDGSRIARGELEVEIEKAESGGAQLAERILASGGEELLAQSREEVGA